MSETSKWKSALGFLTAKSIDHEVGGRTLKFYPISGAMLFQLREIAQPLVDLLLDIFKNDQDNSITEKQLQVDGSFTAEKVVEAIDPELAKVRYDKRRETVEALVNGVFGNEIRDLFFKLVMDSLRETFDRSEEGDPKNWPSPEELSKQIPATNMFDLAMGLFKANKGIIGPFLGNLQQAGSTLWQRFMASTPQDTKSQESDSDNLDQTQTSSGTDSNTSTSGLTLMEDTPSDG